MEGYDKGPCMIHMSFKRGSWWKEEEEIERQFQLSVLRR